MASWDEKFYPHWRERSYFWSDRFSHVSWHVSPRMENPVFFTGGLFLLWGSPFFPSRLYPRYKLDRSFFWISFRSNGCLVDEGR